jgi:hypothetical protein
MYAIPIILALCFLGIYIAYRGEKKIWNNGIAPCGTKWKDFDTDSQGGRGYKCKCGKHSTWVSYWVDRREH